MAEYVTTFTKPYPSGYQDLPSEATPVGHEIIESWENAIVALESYLSENNIPEVSASTTVKSGTKTAIITIDGTEYIIYSPSVSYESAITGGTKVGTITVGSNTFDVYAPSPSAGGSTVSVVPKTLTGTNIAEITVDGTTYQLYAPTSGGGSGSTVTAEATLTEGTQIGKITIDGTETILYAPTASQITVDSELSATSENAVQNKVVKAEFDKVNSNLVEQKMLGWFVPKECPVQNYVDSDGVFHQKVGRVDLGSLDWQYETGFNRFMTSIPGKFKPSNQSTEWPRGLYCVLYEANTSPIIGGNLNMTISGYTNTENLYLSNFSYTDATTFKNAMQGVYLYYELEEEKTISVDGNEAVARIKNDLSDLKDGTTPAAKAVADEDGNNIKSTYIKKTEVPSGSIVDSELSETSVNPVQNKVVTSKLNEVFQSVSSGKSLIASAITDKGITTAADATFQVMADNIGKISVSGSAEVSNPLSMIGNYNFKSKIVLADGLSADNIAITKDSTSIQITSVEKTSDTRFKVTGDFSAISEGNIIKVQTNPGFFFDSNLQSTSDVSVVFGDPQFLIKEPQLDGSVYLTLLYNQASQNYYATKREVKDTKYWAIGLITYCGSYTVPLIVSNVSEHACVTSTYMSGTPTTTYTFEYDGKTYYCNANVQGAQQSSNAIRNSSIPLYNVHDSNYTDNEAGCVYMAKKLLDFYFGKEEFPQ